MSERYSELFCEIVKLAEAEQATPLNKFPGCWECKVDELWLLAINGHEEPKTTAGGATVPPFECYLEFNGFPAGFVGPFGGVMAAGSAANEDTLIEALRKRLQTVQV